MEQEKQFNLTINLVVFFATLLCLFCLLEVSLRLLVWLKTPSSMVFKEDIVYTLKANSSAWTMPLNNIGCIGDDIKSSKSHNEYRVLLLGGSTSFTNVYTSLLQKELHKLLPRHNVKVISCGRPRYTSYINFINYRDYLTTINPDHVILYLGINDNIYNTFPQLLNPPNIGFFNWASIEPISIKYLYYHLIHKPFRSTPNFTAPFRSVTTFKTSLEEIIKLAKLRKAKVLLSTFAVALPSTDNIIIDKLNDNLKIMEHFWGAANSAIKGVAAHNKVMKELSSAYNLPLVDIATQIPKDSKHFIDLCHMKVSAYQIIAKKFAKAIKRDYQKENASKNKNAS